MVSLYLSAMDSWCSNLEKICQARQHTYWHFLTVIPTLAQEISKIIKKNSFGDFQKKWSILNISCQKIRDFYGLVTFSYWVIHQREIQRKPSNTYQLFIMYRIKTIYFNSIIPAWSYYRTLGKTKMVTSKGHIGITSEIQLVESCEVVLLWPRARHACVLWVLKYRYCIYYSIVKISPDCRPFLPHWLEIQISLKASKIHHTSMHIHSQVGNRP